MANLLFSTADRAGAHLGLAMAIDSGLYPKAECREDHNSETPYQVWDGPAQESFSSAPASSTVSVSALSPDLAAAIAFEVVRIMDERK